jgi:hypothetical protein
MAIDLHPWMSEIEDLARGESISVDHTDCEAGEDTRQRLYLTRPASTPNIVLGYCHNCQCNGVWRAQHQPYRDFHKGTVKHSAITKFDVPRNMVPNPLLWPGDATRWRIQKGLSQDEAMRAGIEYDPHSHRVYLPVYDFMVEGGPVAESNLIGFQLRAIEDGASPKYYTAQAEQDTVLYTRLIRRMDGTNCYVLVEDLASGLAVAQAIESTVHTNVGVLVNYGIKTKVEALAACNPMHFGYVWLDNDSDHVRQRALELTKTWALVSGCTTKMNGGHQDPKHYTMRDIRDVLQEADLW